MGVKISLPRRSPGKAKAPSGPDAPVQQTKAAPAVDAKGASTQDQDKAALLRKSNKFWRKFRLSWRFNYWSQLKQGYVELVNAVIRPPRAQYGPRELGPKSFMLGNKHFQRQDLEVIGGRGVPLACSWWQPVAAERLAERLPCVVYMHGNASCRLEAMDCIWPVLQMGLTLFAFDFAGCGMSGGHFITLGHREKDDAEAVIDFLRRTGTVSTMALWGRSMGAATALLHGHRDPSIAAMVLDSPFSSLEQLAREIIDRAQLRHKPKLLINVGLKMLRSSIKRKTGLDILQLQPIANVDKCFIPALFVAGKDDHFIPPHHTGDIFHRYAGEKDFILVSGGHNSERPQSFMNSVSMFLYQALCVPAGLAEARPAPSLRPRRASRESSQPQVQAETLQDGAAWSARESLARLVNTAASREQSTLPGRRTPAREQHPQEVLSRV